MKTAILTDTNSGLTVESGKNMGIHVLPMPVIIEGATYLEGVDITHTQLYRALSDNKEVSSSQPSPGAVMEMWDSILSMGYDELIYIPMSSGLSGSCHNAIQLAEEYGSKVCVADNHRISVTLMDSVLDAKSLADRGSSALEIKRYLESTAYNASIYVTVNSLKYLKKSGRVTPSAAAIADILNIKPILTIQGEKLDSFTKVRGTRQSEKRMMEAIRADITTRFSDIPFNRLRIGTAGTYEKKEDTDRWVEVIQSAFPEISVYYIPLSCSIACHVGVNAAGLGVSVIEENRSYGVSN